MGCRLAFLWKVVTVRKEVEGFCWLFGGLVGLFFLY